MCLQRSYILKARNHLSLCTQDMLESLNDIVEILFEFDEVELLFTTMLES